ncbi:S26 family signal peptidase [Actinokineospora cianjurensis]|uniref:S26 family signal peptidase n=1 Tax=Actinokineospora cianjurensis TaxID=585224 RepID=UPI001FEBBF94|nr:S26 family signal peptidase [Actinokineospora cianjurensis]
MGGDQVVMGGLPVRRVLVKGPSMSPTLQHGDVVVVVGKWPKPGDVVLVTWDDRPGQVSVKRAKEPSEQGWHVEGDNPFASTDSRTLGPARVHAVVMFRLWPRPGRL